MRTVFLGSKELGLKILNALLDYGCASDWMIIHPDDTRDKRSVLQKFIDLARRRNLDIRVAASQSATREMLIDFKPDIAMVCGWYWLLSRDDLTLAKRGFFGVHNSLLPKYRGSSPLVWALINGEHKVGATVFKFGQGMDDGDVAHQVCVEVSDDDDIGTVLHRIQKQLVETMPNIWRGIISGELSLKKQNDGDATYCGQRKPEDGRIDWHRPARDVHNFVRAQSSPYPGAYTMLDGRKIVVSKSRLDGRLYFGTPGQVLWRLGDTVIISCGGASALHVVETTIDGIPVSPKSAFQSINARL